MAETLGEAVLELTTDENKLVAGIKKAEQQAIALDRRFTDLGKKITTRLTLPLAAVGGIALKNAADFEKQQIAFETMLGSADAAQSLLQEIEQFSATTPFQLPGLIQGSKRLLAFGVAADDVVQTMTNLGNAAQGDQAILDRLTLAFGKLRAKGRASLEELNMFTEAGVPILQALADHYDVATDELFKMVTAGQVGFEDVNQALENITTGTGQFAGLIEKQSQSLSGMLSTLKDNLTLVLKDLAELFIPTIKEIISTVQGWVARFRELDEGTQRLIVRISLIAAAIGPVIFIVGKLIAVFQAVRTAVLAVRTAMIAFSATLNINPIFLIITAIAGLTVGIVALIKKLRGQKQEAKENVDQFEDLEKGLKKVEKAEIDLARVREISGQMQARFAELQKLNAELTDLQAKRMEVFKRRLDGTGQSFVNRTKELAALDAQIAEVQKRIDAFKGSTEAVTESQQLWSDVQTEIAEKFEIITQKSRVYGDEFDAIDAKARVLESSINKLLEAGLGFTALSPAVQQLRDQLEGLATATEEDEIAAMERRRQRMLENLDFQIQLENQRIAAAEAEAEREREIQDALDEYLRQQREKRLEEEKALRDLRIQFAQEFTTATGDFVSAMFERQKQAAGENEEAQKRIAERQAKAAKAFALFNAIINTAAAIVNALATPPFSEIRAAFAAATGAAQIAAILARPIPKFQRGADFVVPPGFDGDRFPMLAESGERVQITPRDEAGAGDMAHVTINLDGKVISDFVTKATRDKRIIVDQGAVS
jgi:tape measure domain-containing protein